VKSTGLASYFIVCLLLSISFLPNPIFHYLPSAIFWVVQGSLPNKEILAFQNKNGKNKIADKIGGKKTGMLTMVGHHLLVLEHTSK